MCIVNPDDCLVRLCLWPLGVSSAGPAAVEVICDGGGGGVIVWNMSWESLSSLSRSRMSTQ